MSIYKNGELLENKVIYYDDIDDDDLFGMSNVCGRDVCVPGELPFSFYFSERQSSHTIRVKVLFDPNGIRLYLFGTLELHGNWEYTACPDDKRISSEQIREMKQFFRKYKVLFAGVWNVEISGNAVQRYFCGDISFHKLLQEFCFYEDYQQGMDKIQNIEELEQFVRDNDIFNMWD